MWVEIDKQVAVRCLNLGSPAEVICDTTIDGAFAYKMFYTALGCRWLVVNNYVSAVTQYYIEDINA